MMRIFSPAKINLFLHITGVRTDGYHELQSVFRALDFGDYLEIEPTDGDQLVTLLGADHLTSSLDDNLIVKAAHALAKIHPKRATPVAITLDKQIPTGAGLGGGSSNCAATLIALNELWQLGLSTKELIDIGASLGADVPFFIFFHAHRSDAITTGICEILSPIALRSRLFLLLMPDAHLATAHFFKHAKLSKDSPLMDGLESKQAGFERSLIAPFHNCFEAIAAEDSPSVKDALDYLHSLPSQSTPRMTGTGSAVFLPLSTEDLDHATRWQQGAPCRAIICHSLYGTQG